MSKIDFAEWEQQATTLIRVEMARAGIGYKELSTRLEKMGYECHYRTLGNRVVAGKFSFLFFIMVMKALGRVDFSLDLKSFDLKDVGSNLKI